MTKRGLYEETEAVKRLECSDAASSEPQDRDRAEEPEGGGWSGVDRPHSGLERTEPLGQC